MTRASRKIRQSRRKPAKPLVRLPTEKRWDENYHRLAWMNVLENQPHALLDKIGHSQWASETYPSLSGECRADIFLVCSRCAKDRVVIEIKGPAEHGRGVVFNWQKATRLRGAEYQTRRYRAAYMNQSSGCTCPGITVQFVILDAAGRSKKKLTSRYGNGLALRHWTLLSYQSVLSRHDPIELWLLGG